MDTLTPEQLLFQLQAIATANVTDLMQVTNGNLSVTDTALLSPQQQAAVAAIEKGPGGIKIKFYDKLKALELLIRLMGLGDSGLAPPDDSLLEAIRRSTREVIDTRDLPELQQTPADGHQLVESAHQP